MDVAQANFAVNLLRESVKDSKSTVLSPLSIHMALFMFYYGSLGKTKKEFKELLADGVETESEIVRHMEDLLQDIADSKDKNYTLRLAMRIYVKRRLPVMHGFINTLKDYYGEEVKPLNPRNPEKLAEEINSWVSNVTEQKIKDIVSVDDLRQNLQMLALNALYFKGTWMNQFSSRDTGKKLFYSSEENSREVDMMSLSSYIHHFANNQLRLIKLPYIDGVEMIVILPKKRFNLHSVLQTLSGSDLLRYIQESKPTDVSLQLPKFTLESKVTLKQVLQNLKLNNAFGSNAEFGGITIREIHIDDIIHKGFISVNEEGTEAAATTFASFVPLSLWAQDFKADEPFLFALVKNSKTILFIGQYA